MTCAYMAINSSTGSLIVSSQFDYVFSASGLYYGNVKVILAGTSVFISLKGSADSDRAVI